MAITTNIPEQLAAMRAMTPGQLRDQYRELFGEESRSGNPQWLYRRCAWRLQALAEGDLSERAHRRARELARDADIRVRPPALANLQPSARPGVSHQARGRIARNVDCRLPMPGTRLTRKYKGHIYEVEVLDGGFVYDGEVYQSLSAVAHVITGGHWNGFLFFGLADPRKDEQ
ncbi:MAG TPA: DUF2924 domain-containing protein [Planctomycetota bacterium]|nr:DUF2924 domain-containing protein [Planctomycetota bacterium]